METANVLIMDSDEEQEDIENNCKNSDLTPTRANYSRHGLNTSYDNSFIKSGITSYEKKSPH